MARRWLLAGLAPVLAAAALLLSPTESQAWGWGGYGGYGGGYAGWGGYHGGYGGWHGYYSPYHSGQGWGGYPAYGGYGYTVPNYNTYWGGYYPAYQYPTYQAYSQPGTYQSSYPLAGVKTSNHANVRVEVPTNAEVWFGGHKTNQTGTERLFHSPPLEPKGNYTYEVRARWTENGKVVDLTRNVPVRAGDNASIDFLRQTPERNPATPLPIPSITEPARIPN